MRLSPKDEKFFELFCAVADRNKAAAGQLRNLFDAPPECRMIHVEAIEHLEHEADQVIHELVNRLARSATTPLDREDIHALASKLDDVIDAMDDTARRSHIFRVGQAPDGAKLLAEAIERMVTLLAEAVERLKRSEDIMHYCVEAKRLEEEGDAIYHAALGTLFATERDAIEVIKWKEIYDGLECTLDESEDVANVLESISLKRR